VRKVIIIMAIILFAVSAGAMSKRPHKINNLDVLGSNDRKQHHETTTDPVPIPEPATIIMLGAGMVGIAWARRK
jgi:hypothetical protein